MSSADELWRRWLDDPVISRDSAVGPAGGRAGRGRPPPPRHENT
ncbi:hypothetical protein [Nocardia abscessus]|nr:hypothetical protein [Nocardia abscessus]